MSQLKIYKASAGSGKTFRLAVDYLKLILKKEWSYRHILAVTFTNKATAEMKSRVLNELYELSLGKNTAYLQTLKKELGMPEWEIAERAKKSLNRILHDYSRFSITTIDSFFQRVIKAFNRELGINTSYSVELDESAILDEAVDRLILSVEEDRRLRAWLKEFAENKITEGRGWNLKADILDLGKEIYNDSFRSLNEELYEKLNDKTFIADYHSELNKIIHQFEKTMQSYGNGGNTIIAENALTVDDFKRKKSGPANSFNKLVAGDYSFTATALKAAADVEEWYVKNAGERVKLAGEKLMAVLCNAVGFFDRNIENYNTARLITNQLFVLGILVDLRKMVREICQEKGIVMISDSGHFIKEIIDNSDTPFVYEKTGVVYNHFMIDEFQDTSALQWENFRPLVINSLAEDHYNLVVGDVKQAIYRWRKGDWNLLAGKLNESLAFFGAENEVLNKNWRSCGNIIRLNNTIFTLAPAILQQHFENELEEVDLPDVAGLKPIAEIYSDRIQEIAKTELKDEGFFRMKFMEASRDKKEENEELVKAELLEYIKSLQGRGVLARQIAVLVREKKEARVIAELFLEEKNKPENSAFNFDILSNESLYLGNSRLVGFVVTMMRYFLNPDDPIVLATLNYYYYSYLYPALKQADTLPDFSEGKEMQVSLDFTQAYHPAITEQFEDVQNIENGFIRYLKSEAFGKLVSSKSLQEMVYSVSEKFRLFSIKNELAYLQAFIDQLGVFERGNASEVSSFLNWWDDNADKITIPVADSIDAISILTIHKSKGLEFDHVFIPFCDWSIMPQTNHAPLLWCAPDRPPFDGLKLVPVKYGKQLAKSIFSKEFFTEKFNTYIDNLNLLYVAFTRAKSGLYVWSQTTGKMSTVGDLLQKAVEQNLDVPSELFKLNGLFDEETSVIEFGHFYRNEIKEESGVQNILLDQFGFSDFRKYLSIRKHTQDFFNTEGKRTGAVNKGKIIHEILSGIRHKNELEDSVRKAVFAGKISESESEGYFSEIDEMLNDAEVNEWFNGTCRVINERNILNNDPQGMKRPDRMMIKGDQLIVVDYKSGEHELDKYKTQVRSYISILKQCGYPNVRGYLWYTKFNKRVEV